MGKVFISYSWDSEEHKSWVKALAARLRADGVETTLDQWHLAPGGQLAAFMEEAVRHSDYVLVLCTPRYKDRSDSRSGGVGYEGDIMTGEVLTQRNERKFIPVLRAGEWTSSAPAWLAGRYYIDLRGEPYLESSYDDLLSTLLGTRSQAPPVGTRPGGDGVADLTVAVKNWFEIDLFELARGIVSLKETGRLRAGIKIRFDAPDLHTLQEFVSEQASAGDNPQISIEQLVAARSCAERLARAEEIGAELLVDLSYESGIQATASAFRYFLKQQLMSILHNLASYQLGDRATLYTDFRSWFSGHPSIAHFAHLAYGKPRLVQVIVASEAYSTTNDTHVLTYLPLGRLNNDGRNLISGFWESAEYIPSDIWLDYVIPQAALWRVIGVSTYRPVRRSEAFYATEGLVSTNGEQALELPEDGEHTGRFFIVPKS